MSDPVLVIGDPVVVSPLHVADPVDAGPRLNVGGPADLRQHLNLGDAVSLPVLTIQADGQRVWVGTGLPDVVPGAVPNDLFLDSGSGVLYRLT